jgi:hypothetical protein
VTGQLPHRIAIISAKVIGLELNDDGTVDVTVDDGYGWLGWDVDPATDAVPALGSMVDVEVQEREVTTRCALGLAKREA